MSRLLLAGMFSAGLFLLSVVTLGAFMHPVVGALLFAIAGVCGGCCKNTLVASIVSSGMVAVAFSDSYGGDRIFYALMAVLAQMIARALTSK
jgi:hypothetical protein